MSSTLLANTSSASTGLKDKTKKSHESIIKESIDFFEANSYQPIHVLDLCNELNVKLRTLYRLFQEYYGISPIKYLRLVRYAKARRELIDSDQKKLQFLILPQGGASGTSADSLSSIRNFMVNHLLRLFIII